ncbi:MAG: hypothetical protein WAM73_05120 [Desulfobacterales bacterium]
MTSDILPQATASHRTAERLRIKIPSRKGDDGFFNTVAQSLARDLKYREIRVNALTGSVLMTGPGIDFEKLTDHAAREGLFALDPGLPRVQPLGQKVYHPLAAFSRRFNGLTDGTLDFPGLMFVALCAVGLYEILKGNAKLPPWYTAFWYAFGILTTSLISSSLLETDKTR